MDMFEGVSEGGNQRRKDSERKSWVYILTASVAAVSTVPAGAHSSERRGEVE